MGRRRRQRAKNVSSNHLNQNRHHGFSEAAPSVINISETHTYTTRHKTRTQSATPSVGDTITQLHFEGSNTENRFHFQPTSHKIYNFYKKQTRITLHRLYIRCSLDQFQQCLPFSFLSLLLVISSEIINNRTRLQLPRE